jgi:hypothetical protein
LRRRSFLSRVDEEGGLLWWLPELLEELLALLFVELSLLLLFVEVLLLLLFVELLLLLVLLLQLLLVGWRLCWVLERRGRLVSAGGRRAVSPC